MIPKIICFIFGHIRHWKAFTGNYGEKPMIDVLSGNYVYPPIYIQKDYVSCPRCGANL
jgi:hypothetical protein